MNNSDVDHIIVHLEDEHGTGRCKKCPHVWSLTDTFHAWVVDENDWINVSENFINCRSPLASMIEVHEG